MHDFDLAHVSAPFSGETSSAAGSHHESNFALKVINFAAANKSWRLVCNSGNPKSCEAHCSRQFPGDALSIDECSRAVKESFGGSFFGACFPMNSVVTRKSDGIVQLSQIKVGDEILVAEESVIRFDKVIGFLHWSEGIKIEYVRVDYGSGVLTIHKDHMIPIGGLRKGGLQYVKASTVVAGDMIRTLWIDGTVVESAVRAVSFEEASGMCCPLTISGMIIVDSVVCSCYSSPTGLLPIDVGHSAVHAVMAPVRFFHSWLKEATSITSKPTPGIHPYARALMSAATGVVFC